MPGATSSEEVVTVKSLFLEGRRCFPIRITAPTRLSVSDQLAMWSSPSESRLRPAAASSGVVRGGGTAGADELFSLSCAGGCSDRHAARVRSSSTEEERDRIRAV